MLANNFAQSSTFIPGLTMSNNTDTFNNLWSVRYHYSYDVPLDISLDENLIAGEVCRHIIHDVPEENCTKSHNALNCAITILAKKFDLEDFAKRALANNKNKVLILRSLFCMARDSEEQKRLSDVLMSGSKLSPEDKAEIDILEERLGNLIENVSDYIQEKTSHICDSSHLYLLLWEVLEPMLDMEIFANADSEMTLWELLYHNFPAVEVTETLLPVIRAAVL